MRKFITGALAAILLVCASTLTDAANTASVPAYFKMLRDSDQPKATALSGSDSLGNAVNWRDHQFYIYQGYGERTYSNLFNPGHRCAINLRAWSEGSTNVGFGVVLR